MLRSSRSSSEVNVLEKRFRLDDNILIHVISKDKGASIKFKGTHIKGCILNKGIHINLNLIHILRRPLNGD